ncbi:LacI family DNA-binding transcriptional regulator [Fonticella tunisiensis]|uniref:LacI family transcriptional regulator n=1 Tax=Fonticella tunisiensis TaxID=1096341 RepID=A0A4R7KWM7_9CLOT|nr:LacI family DNA-binding transcriptional regulator [Fonticella tunisiensis]TDT63380.1 LacI family transcriptional regulator [Fonticella tunisiensis]
MVTIKEVAERAGVSPSTVSRVISDSPRISDETKQKVRRAMEELGYHPNAIARSLVNRATNTIGIVMPRSAEDVFLNPFFPEALRGIAKCTHDEGFCVLLTTGNSDDEQIESLLSVVRGGRVDGVILMYSKLDDPILEMLTEMNIPFSMIGRPTISEDINFVDNDNVNAAYEAANYLISMGHRRIGLINGSLNLVVSIDRYEGYKRALAKNKIELDESIIMSSEFVQEGGYESMKKMLSVENPPSAVLVTDDLIAFGAIRAARDMKVKIPDEMSIISFNNIPLADFATPPLTSVDINAYSLGYKAAKLVIDDIKGKKHKPSCYIVETRIVFRDSVISKNNIS